MGESQEIVLPVLEQIFNTSFDICTVLNWTNTKDFDGGGDNEGEESNRNLEEEANDLPRQYTTKDFFPENSFYVEDNTEPFWYKVFYRNEMFKDPICFNDTSNENVSIQRSKKFVWVPETEERVLNVIDHSFEFDQEDFDEADDFDGFGDENKRRVYWSGPGLIQETPVHSLFQNQTIPDGIRPTLAYVSSEEMTPVMIKTTPAVIVTPKPVSKDSLYRGKKSDEKKPKQPLVKRLLSSIRKAFKW